MPRQLSIKSKLIITLLCLSLTALATMGYLSWRTTQAALFDVMQTHLVSVRTTQIHQVERYFDALRSQLRTLAENELTVSATEHLRLGFQDLAQSPVSEEANDALKAYYVERYLPALGETTQGAPSYGIYRPTGNAERHLQHRYLINGGVNTALPQADSTETDEHQTTIPASDYDQWYRHYHPRLQNIATEFGYQALLIVDHTSGDVIYSTRINPILGTNLLSGPYRQSNLAQVVEAVQINPEKGVIQSIDFAPFRPDLSEPAAFLASPIYVDTQMVGILVIQLSISGINRLMPGVGDWEEVGLGESGDSYLVGSDLRMRTYSRHLQSGNDREQLAMPSIGPGLDSELAAALAEPPTTISERSIAALGGIAAGQTDTRWMSNYLGNNVLSAYAPLDIDGVAWSMLTEIEAAEIMQPVYQQQRQFLVTLATLTLATSILIILFAQIFVQPLARLTNGVREATTGNLDAEIKLYGNDEFSDLSHQIDKLVSQMRHQSKVVYEKDRSYHALLHTLVPDSVAKQLQQNKANYEVQASGTQIVNRGSAGDIACCHDHRSRIARRELVTSRREWSL